MDRRANLLVKTEQQDQKLVAVGGANDVMRTPASETGTTRSCTSSATVALMDKQADHAVGDSAAQ